MRRYCPGARIDGNKPRMWQDRRAVVAEFPASVSLPEDVIFPIPGMTLSQGNARPRHAAGPGLFRHAGRREPAIARTLVCVRTRRCSRTAQPDRNGAGDTLLPGRADTCSLNGCPILVQAVRMEYSSSLRVSGTADCRIQAHPYFLSCEQPPISFRRVAGVSYPDFHAIGRAG